MHVIDLKNMVELETVFKSHVGYTPYDRPFFISLDVCEDMWRVAQKIDLDTCGIDIMVLVSINFRIMTVSDDRHVKVWRSHNWFHQQQQQNSREQQEVQFQEQQQEEKQEELQEKEREQKEEIKEPKQQQGHAPLDYSEEKIISSDA